MEYLGWYCLFALTTAIVACIEIYFPVRQLIQEKYGGKKVINHPIIGCVVFIIFSAVIAPIMFIINITPMYRAAFIETMSESLGRSN